MLKAIQNGRFQPGQRIPSEKILTQEFGVSRTTLREAFQKLELLGKISIRQGDGTYLSETSFKPLYAEIQTAFLIGNTDLTQYLEAREHLELTVARLAIIRATKEDLVLMENILKAQNDNLKNPVSFAELDFEFHLTLMRSAKNSILLQFWMSIVPLIKEQQQRVAPLPGMRERALRTHTQLLSAIKQKDASKAQKVIREHLSIIPGRLLTDASRRTKNELDKNADIR